MSQSEKTLCCFTLEGTQFLGELLLDGEHSNVMLTSRHKIPYASEPHSLYGESLDHKKISLHECVGEPSYPEGLYPKFVFKRRSFPHYALIGSRHIAEDERIFSSVSFQTDDVGLLFSARDTFGSASPDPLELQTILESSFPSRKIAIGKSPAIFFFSGVPDSVPVDIGIGNFAADFDFRSDVSGHAGIQCPSIVNAVLKFDTLKSLDEILDDVVALSLFFTVVAGRYQGVKSIEAEIGGADSASVQDQKVSVHWSYAPASSDLEASNLRDIPITPEESGAEFYTVFQRWMSRHNDWLPARLRIINWQKMEEHMMRID
ncbi:ApeA N-terminal domain 1-containing protein [Pseudomonas sp. LF052]